MQTATTTRATRFSVMTNPAWARRLSTHDTIEAAYSAARDHHVSGEHPFACVRVEKPLADGSTKYL